MIGQSTINFEPLKTFTPMLEYTGLLKVLLIISQSTCWQQHLGVTSFHGVLKEVAEAFSAFVIHCAAHRPYEAEYKYGFQVCFERINLFWGNLLYLSLLLGLEEAI